MPSFAIGPITVPEPAPRLPFLMGHQDRNARVGNDVARGAAENHLPQTTLGISPLDEQIRMERGCIVQDGFAWGTRVQPARRRLGSDTVPLQAKSQLRAARSF